MSEIMRNELGKLLGDFILFRLYIMGKFRKRKTLRKRNTFRKSLRGGASSWRKMQQMFGGDDQNPTREEAQKAVKDAIYVLEDVPEENITQLEAKISWAQELNTAIRTSGFSEEFMEYALDLAEKVIKPKSLQMKLEDLKRLNAPRIVGRKAWFKPGREGGFFEQHHMSGKVYDKLGRVLERWPKGGKKSRRKRRKKSRAKRRRTRR